MKKNRPFSKYDFTVPGNKKIRLLIDTDAANEADDQYAIVHALLTPKFDVRGIIAAHFGTRRTENSMNESYDEILKVLDLMQISDQPVFHGAPAAMPDEYSMVPSEGSQAIIDEALKDDPLPLFCIFLGPLTDMASALLARPEIAERLTVVWIGGGAWPDGGEEFNLNNDISAANAVYRSSVELWQVPRPVYNLLKVSLAELQVRVKPYGKIGGYLFSQMVEFNDMLAENKGWPLGESWVLGDSAAVGLLLDQHEYFYDVYKAPIIDKDMKYNHGKSGTGNIRFYKNIDTRFILEDFYCKLKLFCS